MIHVDILKPAPEALKPFIQLPYQLYAGDPNWVGPLKKDAAALLSGGNNALFEEGIQRFFLAYEDERPVARVLAGIDLRRNAQQNEALGYFSLFECYENMDYARAVLDAAVAFLKEHGVTRLRGPISPSYDEMERGLLVQGFDGMPVMFNPYHKPYYQAYLETYGFTKERDYLAYLIATDDPALERIAPLAGRVQQRFGFSVRHIDLKVENQARIAQDMATVICEATQDDASAYLPTAEDVYALLDRIKPYFKPELAVMAYAGTRPIGLVMGFLDYNPVYKRLNGAITPWNWLSSRLAERAIDTARCPMQFVVPEYQNKAVNAVLIYEAAQGAKALGLKKIEGSTVDETNVASINNTVMSGGKLYRVYRIYQKPI